MSAVCDCLVVGDGITAASFAALVAKAGYRTLMVSRRDKASSQQALSLLPAAFPTLHRLEIVEALRRGDAPKKLGLRWFDHSGDEAYSVFFCDFDPYESAQTWHVRQDELQEMVVQQAMKRGVALADELTSLEPMWDGARLVGLNCHRPDGSHYEQYARVTMDTTGLTSLAGPAADQAIEPSARVMISGLYRGAMREPTEDGATLLFQMLNRDGWFRYIPVADNLVSLAAISDRCSAALRGNLAADVYEDLLVECPAAAERLVDAELVGELRVTKHASRSINVTADSGRLAIGDALAFADPLLGAGSFLALKAGEWCADVVVEAMRATDLSAERLGRWIPSFAAAEQRLSTLSEVLHTPGFCWKDLLARFASQRAGLANLFAGKVFDESVMRFCDDLAAWQRERHSPNAPPLPHSA
jgi:flavin-dependent dehydrogenase